MRKTILYAACLTVALTAQAQTIEKNQQVGKGLYELAFNAKDNGVYVASVEDFKNRAGYVYKLNADDLSVEKKIDVQGNPVFGMAINETTQKLYGSNTIVNAVTVIDLATEEVKIIEGTRGEAHNREIAIDEATNTIYVSDVQKEGIIWVIDGNKDVLVGYITNVGGNPTGLKFDKQTKKLYSTLLETNEVVVIDPKKKAVIKKFSSMGESPINVAIDEKGRRAFIANQGTGLTVLNADTGALIKIVRFKKAATLGVTYDAVNNKIYLANREAGKTAIVDGATYEVVSELATGTHPNTVVLNEKAGVAYVTNKGKRIRVPEGEPAQVDPQGDIVSKIKL